jgi:peptidoglycan/LPS O-acetylase OafA/YrhL
LVIAAPLGMIALAIASIWLGHRLPLGRIGMIYLAIIGCRAYRHYVGEIGSYRFALDVTIFMMATIFSNIVSFGYFRHPTITMMEAVLPWFFGPALFLTVSSISKINRSMIFNSKILGWLGTISFSTYLLHPIALTLANAYSAPYISLLVGWLATLLLSVVGYRFVEMPGQALGQAITLGLSSRLTAVPPNHLPLPIATSPQAPPQ